MQNSGTFPGLSDGVNKTIQRPVKALPKVASGKRVPMKPAKGAKCK